MCFVCLHAPYWEPNPTELHWPGQSLSVIFYFAFILTRGHFFLYFLENGKEGGGRGRATRMGHTSTACLPHAPDAVAGGLGSNHCAGKSAPFR